MQIVRIQRGAAVAGLLALLFVLGLGGEAEANSRAKKQIQRMTQQAMENFDLLEYEEAKKLLNEAVVLAKKNNLDDDPVVGRVHLSLGIVHFSGFQDSEAAKLNFIDAVRIDPNIEISAAYKTGEMEALLEEARGEFGGGGGGGPSIGADDIDCASLQGIAHTLVDSAPAGADKEIDAHIAEDLGAAKVSLHYRPQGAADFVEVKMSKAGGCKYSGAIPGDALDNDFLHYYVAAYNKGGKVIASRGSTGSPNIIEVAGAGSVSLGDEENPLGGDDENPLGGGSKKKSGSGGSITGGTKVGSGESKLFLSVALGTGGGFVTGETEQETNEVGCCFAPALLHLFPEVGYFLSPKASVSAAFRMGFPIGANIPGHATAAPAGLLRYRHSLAADGTGLQFNAAIGGGIVRHTVKLTNKEAGDMDTDTVASGPLLLGGGAGYVRPLGGPIRFVAEANVLAGLPIIAEMGECPEDGSSAAGCVRPNFALQIDLNLGLLFAF